MEQKHFEILLERIEDNHKILAEGLAGVIERIGGVDDRLDVMDGRIDRLEVGQVEIKGELREIQGELREIKRANGLLQPIANDHEGRIQGLEAALKDHLGHHP